MYKYIKRASAVTISVMLLSVTITGCNASKNVLYWQNLTPEAVVSQTAVRPIKVQPGDEIMVYVSSPDQEMAARLSLMAGSRRPNTISTDQGSGITMTTNSVMLPYTVDKAGEINMPEIGRIHVEGLTRQEIAEAVQHRIIDAHLAKDNAVNVTVQFANLTFSTIGELKDVGTYSINKDNMTIIEALAASGDLTIYGRRDAVWVLREESDGSRKAYKLDMRGTDFIDSPAYYIQQNDVIYVEPNSIRAGQSTLNENTFKSVGFWTSLASLAITIATFAITLSR